MTELARKLETAMLREFIDLAVQDKKAELFKRCFNRCYAAFNVVYTYEKTKLGPLWNLDERYREQSIEILYERFSYAMAMVVDRFYIESREFHNPSDARRKGLTFSVVLSGSVDEAFKSVIADLNSHDATLAYYEEDYFDEAYEEFWSRHGKLKAEVIAVRKSFLDEELTFLNGFSEQDREQIEAGEFDEDNRDCLHMMRIRKRWQEVDTEKFLTITKREYLPMIIGLFSVTPKNDLFAEKRRKWWKLWRS